MNEFRDSHQQDSPLIICNVWDVSSAIAAGKAGFQCMGTSSAAIATMLGYRDGEEMSFSELHYIVQRIVSNSRIPLSVDLEGGYGRDHQLIFENIRALADLGVAGINIEDSIVNGEREMLAPEHFAATLKAVGRLLKEDQIDIFINVRTDPFLIGHPNPLEETLRRVRIYEEAGADGIFIPCITDARQIEEVVKSTELPINVMCMPNLPDFAELKNVGVKRISMGNFLYSTLENLHIELLRNISRKGSFKPIL